MSRRLRTALSSLAILVPMVVGNGVAATSATADDGLYWYEYKVASHTRTYNTNYNNRLARCNLPCGLEVTRSATRTISVGGGLTRAGAALGLSISSATTKSLSISCEYTKKPSNRTWLDAYPEGYQYFYKIRENKYDAYGALVGTKILSGTYTAFDPRGVRCEKRA